MDNAIIIAVLVAIVGAATWYVIKEKKKGTKCIGCPSGGDCASCSSCSGKESE